MSFSNRIKKTAPRPIVKASSIGGGARLSTGMLVRTVIVGLIAIGGAWWALDRHYTRVLPPMRVPVPPREAPTFDADAGEYPVPDFSGFSGDAGAP
jgi:hypothetical protein